MEYKHVEYIQAISFNDLCDKTAISTTSKKIIIYQKIREKSFELIALDKEVKKEMNPQIEQDKNPSNNYFHNTISFKNSTERKKGKDKTNLNLQTKLNNQFNDSIDLKAKNLSSRSLISVDTNIEYEDNKNILFKSLNFGRKNNFKLDRIDFGYNYLNNEDSLDSFYNSPSILKYQKNKEYDYRWEKITSFTCDSPALSLQWANNEFGNILACSGYNKCVFIFKEEKRDNNLNWEFCSKITKFDDIVSDISFLPKKHSLRLAAITSNGYLKIFYPLESVEQWETQYDEKISKSAGCTCLCCNPSNLDALTIVVGCKKLIDVINIDKNSSKDETIIKQMIKKQDSIKKNDNLLKIVYFKDTYNNPIIETMNENGHEDDITDVDWANQNGRLYHMICSTSKDGKFIIWKFNFLSDGFLNIDNDEDDTIIKNKYFSYKKIYEFNHKKPLWRCSFNNSGVLVSCVDEDGEVFVFLKIGKDDFIKLDINRK